MANCLVHARHPPMSQVVITDSRTARDLVLFHMTNVQIDIICGH
jgi:hypothetical protein